MLGLKYVSVEQQQVDFGNQYLSFNSQNDTAVPQMQTEEKMVEA